MNRSLAKCLGGFALIALCFTVPIVVANRQARQQRNFRVVRERVLYRSGQMDLTGMKRTIHDYGIRTVVTFRFADEEGDTPPDIEEERFCLQKGLNYVRVRPRRWIGETPDDPAPVEPSVQQFLEVMKDEDNYPVLAHCFGGVHRAGAFCAIYRMEFEGWSNERAMQEMKDCGYDTLDQEWDIRGYILRYRPRGVAKDED